MTETHTTQTHVAVRPVEKPVEEYALRLGDDALLLSHRLTEWLTRAPDLEEEVALANIALDLLGQARYLLSRAGQSTAQDEDVLAFRRSDREYRNALIVELPNGDFAHTIIRLLFFSAYQRALYRALEHSADATLAAFAGKALSEVEYHVEYAAGWTVRLGDGTEESHDRAAAAVAELWPYTAELFAADDLVSALSNEGIAADPAVLHGEWSEQVEAVLAQATLGVEPTGAWRPAGGRNGLHTEALSYLLAEMQSVYRAHPGAAW
ncbi:1,2-phenylacetyl-CoA epoxidase subunit PaaC [Actinocrinis sp.]|uniref:1,2-phenylacetyl-CoA epoxidase subunit PaaC n=1 Tax=Actinocrinis sp. TaxID=1920516 RepID=UPI002D469AD1|nr:1,2-phenylacetyl-CoA epoxidase subunit PaaC [Actinocrinis sp.]HZP53454.1 1,2-phenylacetyl-CoA epoxidase subunit PaaC [Actinocrinis sp.]